MMSMVFRTEVMSWKEHFSLLSFAQSQCRFFTLVLWTERGKKCKLARVLPDRVSVAFVGAWMDGLLV